MVSGSHLGKSVHMENLILNRVVSVDRQQRSRDNQSIMAVMG